MSGFLDELEPAMLQTLAWMKRDRPVHPAIAHAAAVVAGLPAPGPRSALMGTTALDLVPA